MVTVLVLCRTTYVEEQAAKDACIETHYALRPLAIVPGRVLLAQGMLGIPYWTFWGFRTGQVKASVLGYAWESEQGVVGYPYSSDWGFHIGHVGNLEFRTSGFELLELLRVPLLRSAL